MINGNIGLGFCLGRQRTKRRRDLIGNHLISHILGNSREVVSHCLSSSVFMETPSPASVSFTIRPSSLVQGCGFCLYRRKLGHPPCTRLPQGKYFKKCKKRKIGNRCRLFQYYFNLAFYMTILNSGVNSHNLFKWYLLFK